MGGPHQTPKNDRKDAEGNKEHAGGEAWPSVSKDDSVDKTETASGEGRSFEGEGANLEPRAGSGGGGPDPSVNQGHMGPGGDPAEGKR
jgi:hypothetical protein